MALVVPFHGHDLHRLVFQRIESVQIAQDHLHRRYQRGHPHGHGEHTPDPRVIEPTAEEVKGRHPADHEGRGEIRRRKRVRQAEGEAGVEDDGPPVLGHELTVLGNGETRRRLHPAVHRENPGRRDCSADGDHGAGEHVQALPDLFASEQHDAEETGFQEERGQHLVSHEGADDRPGAVREDGPIGAELIGHGNARHHAHGEDDGEDLYPETEEVQVHSVPCAQPQAVEHGEVTRQTDGQGGKYEMKGHGERELKPRQSDRIEGFQHDASMAL
jgi:hypothetical protein